jgi:ATP-dependent helicase/DNAse subunit B
VRAEAYAHKMPDDQFKLSVSKSKCFDQCKKQYKYTYILRLPRKEASYHILGHICHKTLETFHNFYIKGCLLPFNIALNDAFKSTLQEYKEKLTPEIKKECLNLVGQYLNLISTDPENHPVKNVIACEKKFEIKLADNIILNGAIDLIREDNYNGSKLLHIGDYKTTKNKKYLKNDWQQLLTYCFVMLEENPKLEKIRASYILLRHDYEYITRDFSREEILAVKQQYLDYANKMMNEKEFAASPTILCGWCDHLSLCAEGQKKVNPIKTNGQISW